MATILLLDDDAFFRRAAAAALAHRHEVIEASRCKEADQQLRGRPFDLLICDGLLPDGDGLQWIAKFRQRDAVTPILFVSAFRKDDAETLKLKLPNLTVLHKPVLPAELMAKVENALRSTTGAAAAPALPKEAVAELELLRADYARELPGQVRGVRSAAAELRRNPGSPVLRGIARRRAHTIAGGAGSFGFDAIGDACAAIEQAVLLFAQDEGKGIAEMDRAMALLGEAAAA